MNKEIEIVKHTSLNCLEVFLVEMSCRTPHGHKEREIVIILEGSIWINIDGEKSLLFKNDIVVMNNYQLHSFETNNEKCLILALQIDSKVFSQILCNFENRLFEQNILQNANNTSYVKSLIIELSYFYFAKIENYELKCMSLLTDLLFVLLHILPNHIISEKENKTMRYTAKRLNRISNYIEENYCDRITLSEIAGQEHLSVYYLSHFIKNSIGISFQEYLNSVRFDHAFQLLVNTDLGVVDICMQTGFSNSRYLNNMIREKFGCETKEFRKKHIYHIDHTSMNSAINNSETFINDKVYAQRILQTLRTNNKQVFLEGTETYTLSLY